MAVHHTFKATEILMGTSGGVSLLGVLTLNGVTPINVPVTIAVPSSPGHNEAVIFGPLSNARVIRDPGARKCRDRAAGGVQGEHRVRIQRQRV
jgi:hypothetical protein